MKNAETWRPSKYELKRNRYRASRDTSELAVSSRLMADLIVQFYSRAVPQFASGRILDLGCGKVPLYGLYRPFSEETYCVDWEMSPHESQYVDLFQDLSMPLSLATESFNTVILSDVLEHIKDPEALMHEVSRVMAPEGTLLMNVPFLYWLHEEPFDYYRYTRYSLEYLLEKSGLQIIELSPLGGAIEVFCDMGSKIAANIPVVGSALAQLIQRLDEGLLWTKVGKRIAGLTGARFPLGYSLIARKSA